MITKLKNSTDKSYISSDMDIEKYGIVFNISKNNQIRVEENIRANFKEGSKGIFKYIPNSFSWKDEDGNLRKKKVKITNLREKNNKSEKIFGLFNSGIKIGSPKMEKTAGIKDYSLTYKCNLGDDEIKGRDEFIFVVSDNLKENKIKKIEITLNFPEDTIGTFGPYENIKVISANEDITKKTHFSFNDGKINLELDPTNLKDLYIKVILPDNYFAGVNSNYGIISLVALILIIGISIYTYLMFNKYGRDQKRTETVEFYSPNGLDPAEIGYIYGEKNINKLTTALIISLANKRYLKLEKIETTNKLGKEEDRYVLTKIRNITYNEAKTTKKAKEKTISALEYMIFNELFKNDNICYLQEAENKELILKTVQAYLEQLTKRKVEDQISGTEMVRTFANIIISLILFLINIYINDLNPKLYFLNYISIVSIIITILSVMFMGRKTVYGEEIKAKILGFKKYLESAEKDEIELLNNENYEVYYNILPYAYVLGIDNKWIKDFQNEHFGDLNIKIENENGVF